MHLSGYAPTTRCTHRHASISYEYIHEHTVLIRAAYIDYSAMGIRHTKENLVMYYPDRFDGDSPRRELQDCAITDSIMPLESIYVDFLFSEINKIIIGRAVV